MCGIVGIASRAPVQDRSWVARGRDAQAHRGPDAAGEWWSADGRVGFGHRRLAVVDLSELGNQPMRSDARELCIVYNGEIYNFVALRAELVTKGHSFRSQSDTEIILGAYTEWGPACLDRLDGMFAFALYDGARKQLLVGRDRAGEKPLFYKFDGASLRFSSELKGLLADPQVSRQLDLEALDCFLSMGFVPGERAILRGVNKLPPAHGLSFDLVTGDVRSWRYWSLPLPPEQPQTRSTPELLEELQEVLRDAVARQLVADVPVGVLLSGGVDSSLVTALAASVTPKLKTFTVGFPGHGTYDEREHARLIAHTFDTEHIECEAAVTGVELLPMLARQFDEPIIDSSMLPTYLVSRAVRQHCTVVLGGDGGDELFGGYDHYRRLLWMQPRAQRIPRLVRSAVASAAAKMLPVGYRGRNWLLGLVDAQLHTGLPQIALYFDPEVRRRLAGVCPLVAEGLRRRRIPDTADLLQRATRMDFENYLAEDILVKVDRASMLASLEVRAPFLDRRVIEFAYGAVPSHLKATASEQKILLKQLASRVLPRAFNTQRKQGFSIPLVQWLKAGVWREFFHETLLGSRGSFFSREVVHGLLQGQEKGRANSERLFALVMFELWRSEYNVSL